MKQWCPVPLRARFSYTHNDGSALTCGGGSSLSLCPDWSILTFDYSLCSTEQAFSSNKFNLNKNFMKDTTCIFKFHILLLLIIVHAWYVFRGRHCLLCQFRVWWNRIPHNCDKPRQCVSVQPSQILLLCTYFTNYEITVSLLIFFIKIVVHIMEMIWL